MTMSPLGRPLGASRAVRRVLAAGLLCGLVAAAPGAGAQAVRGLVVGIDDYAHLKKLQGAVNDARDVHRALAGIGADDLALLLDGDATRDRILAEWRGLLERAAPGDTLVLAYAGHGGQETERVPGSEDDGQDEALLLGGFRSAGPGTRERIVDDELNQWFLDAGAKGLQVVFVADACHSGTLTRSIVDPRAPAPSYRTTPQYTLSGDALALDLPEEAADTFEAGEGPLAHVSLLAAAQEDEKVPEIAVGGEMRGALSYLFARALRGEADGDGDGVLRRAELWGFVRENVRMESEARQTPNLLPRTPGREAEAVLRLAPSTGARPAAGTEGTEGAAQAAVEPAGPAVRLAVLHAGADTLAAVRETLPGVRLVADGEPTDLVWDARERQVVTGMRDVAAHDVGLEALPGVVGKWRAVAAVKALSARAPLRLRIVADERPDDGVHELDDRITVRVEGLAHPQLTVFSLSGDGTVHYLYPLPRNGPLTLAAGTFELPTFKVLPPFGADHVVAVSAGSALDGLNAALRRLDGEVAADLAVKLLARAKAGADGWRSGVQGLYTAP